MFRASDDGAGLSWQRPTRRPLWLARIGQLPLADVASIELFDDHLAIRLDDGSRHAIPTPAPGHEIARQAGP